MKSPIAFLIMCTALIGCSSGSPNNESSSDSALIAIEREPQSSADGSASSDDPVDNSSGGQGNTDAGSGTTQPDSNGTSGEPDDSQTSGQDPLIQNVVDVTFDITVPAYQSNQLQVGLVWEDMDLTAQWVGDEYWSATAQLPTGRQGSLKVTFYDYNGDIELAIAEQEFTTGSNSSQSVNIEADQFDSEPFDADGDGASNFDELMEGNDPLVDESTLFEIQDSIDIVYLTSTSQLFERELTDERPYSLNDQNFEPFTDDEDSDGTYTATAIDIDADGNGTYSFTLNERFYRESQSGTRTHSGNSISWEGSLSTYDGDYGRSTSFTSTVSELDTDAPEIHEELSEVYSGFYRDTWDVVSQLTGERIEGTSLCKPVAGSVTYTRGTNRDGGVFGTVITNVTKEVGDRYWKVSGEDSEITNYLARELKVAVRRFVSSNRIPEDITANFKCDFADSVE